jgi:hypothetical protein
MISMIGSFGFFNIHTRRNCMRKGIIIALALVLVWAGAGICASSGTVSASTYKAGDTVTIEGKIDEGKDLYIAIAQNKMFAVKDTNGVHEIKKTEKGDEKK